MTPEADEMFLLTVGFNLHVHWRWGGAHKKDSEREGPVWSVWNYLSHTKAVSWWRKGILLWVICSFIEEMSSSDLTAASKPASRHQLAELLPNPCCSSAHLLLRRKDSDWCGDILYACLKPLISFIFIYLKNCLWQETDAWDLRTSSCLSGLTRVCLTERDSLVTCVTLEHLGVTVR